MKQDKFSWEEGDIEILEEGDGTEEDIFDDEDEVETFDDEDAEDEDERMFYCYVHRAFCPTGPGGGVDNSCGSKEGGGTAAKKENDGSSGGKSPGKSPWKTNPEKNGQFITKRWGKNIHPDAKEVLSQLPASHLKGSEAFSITHRMSDQAWANNKVTKVQPRGTLGVISYTTEAPLVGALGMSKIFTRDVANHADTLRHEFGHSIERQVETIAGFRGKEEWATVWKSEGKAGRITKYGKTNSREAFAEAYMMYSHGASRGVLAAKAPKAHAFMKKLFAA